MLHQEDVIAMRKLRDEDTSGDIKKFLGDNEDPSNSENVKVLDGRVIELYLRGHGTGVVLNTFKKLPDAIGDLTQLQKLTMVSCTSLIELPETISGLKSLTTLDLGYCKSIEKLPDAIGDLKQLSEFNIKSCTSLIELPETISGLKSLTTLDLSNCKSIEKLPDAIGELVALNDISLKICTNLKYPPAELYGDGNAIVGFFCLKHIEAGKVLSAEVMLDVMKANFLNHAITNKFNADLLGSLTRRYPFLADICNDKNQRAIEVAQVDCRRSMQKALFLLGRYDIDKVPPLHFSATAVVLSATDYIDVDNPKKCALKAMKNVDQVVAELAGRKDLDSKFVVAVVGVHVSQDVNHTDRDKVVEAIGNLKGVHADYKADLESLPSTLAKIELGKVEDDRYHGYRYLVVMELAGRSLGTALLHERIASNEWPLVKKIGIDLANALDHLHCCYRIHGDFKPLNIVRVVEEDDKFTTFFSWQLIDLDVSCIIECDFGNKPPSSGYCPPEMAQVLMNSFDKEGVLDTKKLSTYKANVAYDLWSFGVVLYHLGSGRSLWHTNQDDSISKDDLKKLANWSTRDLKYRLSIIGDNTKDRRALHDLVAKLLEPNPKARLNNFKCPNNNKTKMKIVLQHPFLATKDLDDPTLNVLVRKIEQSHKQIEQSYKLLQTIDTKMDKVIGILDAHFEILSDLLKGTNHIAPKLICFLPLGAIDDGDEKSWWRKMFKYNPGDLFNQEVLVFFVDPLCLRVAPTKKNKGFKVKFPKDWVVRAKPWLELGLTTLKIASIAGRLTGFPVPDIKGLVDGWLDGQIKNLQTLTQETISHIASKSADEQLATEQLQNLSKYATSAVECIYSDAMPVEGGLALEKSSLKETIQKSVEELDKLLGSGWQKDCGLVKETSKEGKTEWILEEHAAEFKEYGAEFITNTYGVKSVDPGKTADKQRAVKNAQEALKEIDPDEKIFKLTNKKLDSPPNDLQNIGNDHSNQATRSKSELQNIYNDNASHALDGGTIIHNHNYCPSHCAIS